MLNSRPSESGDPSPPDSNRARNPGDRNKPPAPAGSRRKFVFTPDGRMETRHRPEGEVRPPRPGKRERAEIRDGRRPFFRGQPPRDAAGANGSAGRENPADPPRARPDGPPPAAFRASFRDRRPFEPGARDRPPFGGRPARDDGGPRFRPDRAGDFRDEGRGPGRREFQAPAPDQRTLIAYQMAAEVLQKASADMPLDRLLREALRQRSDLPPGSDRHTALLVFAHCRWRGWIDPAGPMEDQLRQADLLAARFRSRPGSFSDEELAARAAPAWVAKTVAAPVHWWRSLQTEPPLWLRTRPGLAAVVGGALGAEPGPLQDSLRYAGIVDLFRTPEFHAGQFEIQDIASQLVSQVCQPQPGQWWWDACAGEGGKTLHLAAMMHGQGQVWATDRAQWRLDRMRRRAARAACFNYRAVHWDGGRKPPTRAQFHGALVDGPCSGLGTWGRNPHARWTLTPGEVGELAAIQRSLLENVAPSVRPGGRLVYAVCTMTLAETTDLVDAFTQAHSAEFEPAPFSNPLAPTHPPVSRRWFWPTETGGNGMFIAVWKRR